MAQNEVVPSADIATATLSLVTTDVRTAFADYAADSGREMTDIIGEALRDFAEGVIPVRLHLV